MKKIIDLHQDLMLYVSRPDLYKDRQQTSFEQIKKNNMKVVIASAFPVPDDENYLDPVTNRLIEKDLVSYNEYVKDHPEFKIIRTQTDLQEVLSTEGLFGLILHIEGLNVFNEETDWELLEKWYGLGLRSVGPMWNIDNPFGGGTLSAEGGLTELGKKLIAWLEKKNMIVDFAHMNEKTFWDASNRVIKPLFISHGNARAVCENVRNYTDEQIRSVAQAGGVMGIFFSKKFLSVKDNVTLDDVIDHIDRIISVGGVDHVALGTDFGGIVSGFADGLNSVDSLANLRDILAKRGYAEDAIEKIFYENAKKILESYF